MNEFPSKGYTIREYTCFHVIYDPISTKLKGTQTARKTVEMFVFVIILNVFINGDHIHNHIVDTQFSTDQRPFELLLLFLLI